MPRPATRPRTAPSNQAIPPSIGRPALSALASVGVQRLSQLRRWTEADLAALHGVGPKAIGILRTALLDQGSAFAAPPRQRAPKAAPKASKAAPKAVSKKTRTNPPALRAAPAPAPRATSEVVRYLDSLVHPRKEELLRLRATILDANRRLHERIKWNAPSFAVNDDDRVTFRLQPGPRLELIFHRGAKRTDSKDFAFDDPSGLLEWLAPDRARVSFQNATEVRMNERAVAKLVARWIRATT